MKNNNHNKNLYPDPELPPAKEDFRETFQWRVFKIMAELIDGFDFLADLKKTITIFGSSSFSSDNHYYQEARKLSNLLAKDGYTIVTGGGPGIMEAANRGAFEAKGESVGINIRLPDNKERRNKYVKKAIQFYYFFTRKLILSFSAKFYVFFPGGFGTLDEFFEILTLIQTKKTDSSVPVIVVGKEYWQPLFKWIKSEVYLKNKAIKKANLDIFKLVDSAEEAHKLIKKLAK